MKEERVNVAQAKVDAAEKALLQYLSQWTRTIRQTEVAASEVALLERASHWTLKEGALEEMEAFEAALLQRWERFEAWFDATWS